MTEHDWLISTDPQAMLRYLTASDRKLCLFACACCRQMWDGEECSRCCGRGLCSLLLNTAYGQCPDCHGSGRIGGLTDPRSRRAVEEAERYVDGEGCSPKVEVAPFTWDLRDLVATACGHHVASDLVVGEIQKLFPTNATDLIRDIFGNPFRTVTQESIGMGDWYGMDVENVVDLARTIYRERRFGDMPILGDALEEAGCDNEDVLRHCRGMERCLVDHKWKGVDLDKASGVEAVIAWGKTKRECACQGTGWKPLRGPHVRGCWVLDMALGKE